MRIPKHIGIIPDGNRRWAVNNGLNKEDGYDRGLNPGLELFKICENLGVNEITYYGFTVDNTKRPSVQSKAFIKACVDAVDILAKENVSLLVIGNTNSKMFPKELMPYTNRTDFKDGKIKVNFLVNYGWNWDIDGANSLKDIKSNDISRIDLIIRWGGRRRLSGFLPIQSVYSDFFIVDDYWPSFKKEHVYEALNWYNEQDVTLGG